MIRRPKRSSTKNKKTVESSDNLIRQNSATVYGLYFASSNTDFLLDEKKTRFSLRPNVVVKPDRQTVLFDYSGISGDENRIFDGFFRGYTGGGTANGGETLTLGGGTVTTCNYINEVTGIPITNFADTYTITTIDVSKKIIVAIKENPITSTTAVVFESNYWIDLPQWEKTQTNKNSSLVDKILNLLPSQSITKLGISAGSVLEFAKTNKNNNRFTVKNIYTQNGIECIDVVETVIREDASEEQVIVSVYGKNIEPTEVARTERGPLVVQGYYPLYTTILGAVGASPNPTLIRDGETTTGYHVHILNGRVYYMPNGLVMNETQFHGNYIASDVEVEVEVSTPVARRTVNSSRSTTTTPIVPSAPSMPSTPIVPSAPTTPSAPSTPYVPPSTPYVPPSTPSSPSPPSSGGGGY